jgi:sigma-B regulation protein RsbU (phosphoserine phosphatase)
LLIGDQPKCLQLLRKQPFEVICAGGLADGLAQLKARHFGLVLLSLSLPDGQGMEAFTKIHEAAPLAPIIVLTAKAEEKLAATMMSLGAQDYLPVAELAGPMLARTIQKAIERHRIREEHSRAGHLLKVLMDNIPDSIYFKDAASRFVMINRSQAKKFGLADPHLAVGKSDADFFKPAHAQQALADEQCVMQTGQPLVGIEEKETWPDGRVTWVSTTKMPLRDRSGRVVGTFGISRDITERRQIEQTLAERTDELSKERLLLRTLIDNLPDAIYAKDAAGRKTMANPADLKNLRCKTEADAIGKSDYDLFPPEVAKKFYDDDQKVIQGEPVINREEHFFDEAGRKRWLLTSKLPLCDQDGKIVGLVGIGHDITKRKEVELALAERTQELEQKHKQTAEELKMARELQLAMLPHEFPCVPRHKPRAESDLEFFSFFFPAGAVSGDFFDVIPLSDTTVGLFICDVMGHDVRAALVTSMMRALVVDLSATTGQPGELLAQINREVAGVFNQTGSTMYATAFYLIADVASGEFRYASAAHPEPILLHRQPGTVEWLGHGPEQKKGPALGLFAEGQFPTHRCPMKVGDVIALFTDGLIEAEGANNESFSPERLLEAVRQRAKFPTNDLFTGLLDEIKQFSTNSEFEDDVCIVGVEVKRLEAEQPN